MSRLQASSDWVNWSTRSRIVVSLEDSVGELRLPNIADDILHLIRGYAGDGRHVAEHPVMLLRSFTYGVANAEVRMVARMIDSVD